MILFFSLKKTFLFTTLLLCLSFFALANKKKYMQLQAAETARYTAMMANDTMVLKDMLANSLQYIHSNGMLDTKESFIHSMSTQELVHKNIAIQTQTIRIYRRKTGIVSGKCIYDIVYKGSAMTLSFFYTNVYYKLKGKWLLINRQTTKLS
jgi:hypothetical protein